MSSLIALALLPVVFFTSLLSGIFGMAGGLILLWFLLLTLPASVAMVVHGVIQLCANASRAWMSRRYIQPRIVGIVSLGGALAAALLVGVQYTPNAAIVSIVLGLLPVLVWIPKRWFQFDAARPLHALACGFFGGGLTVAAGVAGPTVDLFFIRTQMDRRQIVATKAAIQTIAHSLKIAFYFQAAFTLSTMNWGLIVLSLPLSILGTRAGNGILHRLTDVGFRYWTRRIVTVIGGFYLLQGLWLLH